MKQTEHCVLCDNKITDFKIGAVCGLTNKKPDFQDKCGVIKLDEHFKEKIIEANIKYEAVIKAKTNNFGFFFFYLIITILIFVMTYVVVKYAINSRLVASMPIIILSISIITLGKAFSYINDYYNQKRITKKTKDKIDTIAALYGYQYTINIEHLKDSLGNLSYITDLKLRRKNNQSISHK